MDTHDSPALMMQNVPNDPDPGPERGPEPEDKPRDPDAPHPATHPEKEKPHPGREVDVPPPVPNVDQPGITVPEIPPPSGQPEMPLPGSGGPEVGMPGPQEIVPPV